jgi:hypothetical protein
VPPCYQHWHLILVQATSQCGVHELQIKPGRSCCDDGSSERCRPQRCRQGWLLHPPKRLIWQATPRFTAMHFKVSAVLPVDARTFLVERDSAAFRALVAKTQKLGALEIEDGWRDGDVQVSWCMVVMCSMPQLVQLNVHSWAPQMGTL